MRNIAGSSSKLTSTLLATLPKIASDSRAIKPPWGQLYWHLLGTEASTEGEVTDPAMASACLLALSQGRTARQKEQTLGGISSSFFKFIDILVFEELHLIMDGCGYTLHTVFKK